jgi:hypothetical protein
MNFSIFSGFAVISLRKSLNLLANMPKAFSIFCLARDSLQYILTGKRGFVIFFLSIIFITQHL